jgi:hypothetical protein
MSLYSELLAVGIAVPYHESDLYFQPKLSHTGSLRAM